MINPVVILVKFGWGPPDAVCTVVVLSPVLEGGKAPDGTAKQAQNAQYTSLCKNTRTVVVSNPP